MQAQSAGTFGRSAQAVSRWMGEGEDRTVNLGASGEYHQIKVAGRGHMRAKWQAI
jgi:hypothetical protein